MTPKELLEQCTGRNKYIVYTFTLRFYLDRDPPTVKYILAQSASSAWAQIAELVGRMGPMPIQSITLEIK